MARKKPTLEDHIRGIIAGDGPEGAPQKKYEYRQLEKILEQVHSHGKLLDLRSYHFKGTRNIWNLDNGKKNYALAREATGELIDILREEHGWSYEEVVQNIKEDTFKTHEIKYGAKLGGMVKNVYEYRHADAFIDYFKHHQDPEVRERFRNLKPYHFSKAPQNMWVDKKGNKNFRLARKATGELLLTLKKKYDCTYAQLISKITEYDFFREEIDFGTTVSGMFQKVYDSSPSWAVMNFFRRHTDKRVRKRFADLRAYHFSGVPKYTWVRKNGRKKRSLAREATGELLQTLQESEGWSQEEAIENIRLKHFQRTPIKFGATLGGMIRTLYEDDPKEAVRDYLRAEKVCK